MSADSPSPGTPAGPAPGAPQRLDAAQLAEAFAMFSRASEELSTAYNALQGQVAQLTERLTVLLGALPAGVVMLDRGGHVVQFNRAAESLLGTGLAGRCWDELAVRLIATETPGELNLGDEVGARRVSLSEAALESGEGRIILLHDVTDTHRMRLQAERNERLAAMGEMVAGLAHQLRTPLAAALLYTGNLRQPELAPADRTRVADRAIERLRYLERLIRDMLLFARGDSLGRQRFGICDLVGELVHTLEPLARARQIEFSSHCDCGELTLLGDRKALGGALTNLLENAIQATDAAGSVALAATLEGESVCFRVSDNGRGIEAAHQTRLFDPFFTTRADGTGLGLAIARGVARGHGGDIAVESSLGKGSLFTLSLPLLRPEEGESGQNSKDFT
ncbi:sensor histidine kinase [Aromatoleum diolicum]|uniref:histidine kinase n=1 Tax=Aromatoleum diolicum TaxID=75796 RepID=A0ABX1QDA8_9RHOO|nr:ATP-binding protein [Aromatoleum diolicum]NMG76402.1 PAS domain-containing protein [Aromatoleum diolicum]